MSIYNSTLSPQMKRSSLHGQNPLQRKLSVFSTRFPLSFQSPTLAILPCEYERIAMLRRSLHMSNLIVCATIGAIGLDRSLRQLTICLLSSKSSSPQRNQE